MRMVIQMFALRAVGLPAFLPVQAADATINCGTPLRNIHCQIACQRQLMPYYILEKKHNKARLLFILNILQHFII